MSADFIAYEDCEWEPEITVVNPDGTRETRRLSFSPKEGAKIYIDHAVYDGVGEPYGGLDNHISQDRLEELWAGERR